MSLSLFRRDPQPARDTKHANPSVAEHAPYSAARWLNRFEEALQSLSENPARCGLAPENDLVDPPIHQFFHGKRSRRYRALFTIEDNRVVILHIRRGTMDKAAESELFG